MGTHGDLRLPGIPPEYKIANQFICSKSFFIQSGGFDCINFEYSDKPVMDWAIRCQYNGSKVYFAPKHCCIATWLPRSYAVTIGPIHNAQTTKDEPLFKSMYSNPNILEEREVEYDNWKQAPEIWERRFGNDPDKLPKTYEELILQKGYKF